jgi:hypothetical protein
MSLTGVNDSKYGEKRLDLQCSGIEIHVGNKEFENIIGAGVDRFAVDFVGAVAGAADSDFDSDEMACFGKEASDSDDRHTSKRNENTGYYCPLSNDAHQSWIVNCQSTLD